MMDYLLEQLGPDRFQQVCQALLAKAFPKTQCFPLGQRDGGRDATTLFPYGDAEDFIVYQMKFVQNPQTEIDPHRKLRTLLQEEAPKVRSLIPKGAKQYYLLTNISGTAYPDAGSIDSVQSILDEHLPIPGQCWWRDDINRRLDNAWDIKWSYPEILRGTDILRLIVEQGLGEHAERRTTAIRAYVRDQFARDTEVRFKQVELQNKLLDLFVDVPIDLVPSELTRWRATHMSVISEVARSLGNHAFPGREQAIGAARLLLHPLAQANLPCVVLEGAPGQGKSTVVQYICQIHRTQLLGDSSEGEGTRSPTRATSVRLPIKLDCRDLAVWLDQRNPFAPDDNAPAPEGWHKSLESFLAAHITHYSGGSLFSVSDLQAVARISALLLVCDGLDEVADIQSRKEVVDAIATGVNRLRELAASLQTIVTSRPAAFANAPGLSELTFTYIQLGSITRPLIDEYAEKWLRARRLDGKEAADVRRILRDKVDQPHLRELARNPMQLAILLSLIQTRGGSLPDKRTSLYDSYVDLFFNREAEKSTVVRDHRDLLLDIHRYLAWILQSESQTKQTRGSVSAQRLHDLVAHYLSFEGHNVALAHTLFTGLVERVVALVSRVEGTYEFEVQPLREYFAARHLYNTAQYSPPGGERAGTLPDRFDALARDFFWQNVTRFYAGCYSKGELPSLVDRLEELARSPGYKSTSHAQLLATTLLSDWVFAQHPRSMKQVVALIIDGPGLRHMSAVARSHRGGQLLVLPQQSGREEVVARSVSLLRDSQPRDYGAMLVQIWRANATPAEARDQWYGACAGLASSSQTVWMRYGWHLGILDLLTDAELEAMASDPVDVAERLSFLDRGGQSKFVEAKESRFQAVVDYILDSAEEYVGTQGQSLLSAFGQVWAVYRYMLGGDERASGIVWQRYSPEYATDPTKWLSEGCGAYAAGRRCAEVVALSVELDRRPPGEWATRIGPWQELVEGGRARFGERWAFIKLASVGAGIRSKEETCDDARDLFDETVPLARRARYARLRAGSASWWERQLADARTPLQRAHVLLMLGGWAGGSVIERLCTQIDEMLVRVDSAWWERIIAGCGALGTSGVTGRRAIALNAEVLPATMSDRMIILLSLRAPDLTLALGERLASTYDGADPTTLGFCQEVALRAIEKDRTTAKAWLPVLANSYDKGARRDGYFNYAYSTMLRAQRIPKAVAEEVVENCDHYPIELVGQAKEKCRRLVATRVAPVGAVAEADHWFGA